MTRAAMNRLFACMPRLLAGIALLAAAFAPRAEAEGRTVTVYFTDTTVVRGELIAAGESTLVVSRLTGLSDVDLLGYRAGIVHCGKSRLQKVVVEGSSKFLPGMLIGLVGGAAFGIIAASSVEESNPSAGFLVPLAQGSVVMASLVGGMALGGLVGAASSTSDYEEDVRRILDLRLYRAYARYGGEIPAALRGSGP